MWFNGVLSGYRGHHDLNASSAKKLTRGHITNVHTNVFSFFFTPNIFPLMCILLNRTRWPHISRPRGGKRKKGREGEPMPRKKNEILMSTWLRTPLQNRRSQGAACKYPYLAQTWDSKVRSSMQVSINPRSEVSDWGSLRRGNKDGLSYQNKGKN